MPNASISAAVTFPDTAYPTGWLFIISNKIRDLSRMNEGQLRTALDWLATQGFVVTVDGDIATKEGRAGLRPLWAGLLPLAVEASEAGARAIETTMAEAARDTAEMAQVHASAPDGARRVIGGYMAYPTEQAGVFRRTGTLASARLAAESAALWLGKAREMLVGLGAPKAEKAESFFLTALTASAKVFFMDTATKPAAVVTSLPMPEGGLKLRVIKGCKALGVESWHFPLATVTAICQVEGYPGVRVTLSHRGTVHTLWCSKRIDRAEVGAEFNLNRGNPTQYARVQRVNG